MIKAAGGLVAASALMGAKGVRANQPLRLYDSHCHLISDDTTKYPQKAVDLAGDKSGQKMPPIPGEYFGHIKVAPTLSNVLQWMHNSNVEAAAAVQKKSTYGYDNSYTLDASDVVADKFVAVVVVDAKQDNTHDVIRQYAEKHNLAGIRLSGLQGNKASYDWLQSNNARKCWQVAHELKLTVDVMAVLPEYNEETMERYQELASTYNDTKLVLNHLAWPHLSQPNYGVHKAITQINSLPNVYFKFTTINLNMLAEANINSADFMRVACDNLGAHKLLWGSDIGNSAGTYSQMVQRMLVACETLNNKEKHEVLYKTAKQLYHA
ncbi:amidohydrolase [Alteromonas sp. NFXS44]|uniref:amidohydrolase family protein n=1 Tax=Alteromonas sp. NFXS44 TaxID=2818435 RepID=UPI0032DF141C